MTACRCWFLYRRKKEQKKDTRTTVVRIPGGASWFRTRANYAAFENRGMTQVMPILIADNMDGCKPAEVEQRTKEVRAFRKGEWGAWGVGLSGGGWHGWSGRGGGGGLGGLFTVLGGDSEAVRLQGHVLTRRSRCANVRNEEDPVLWVYREALGSDMDGFGRCLVKAGVNTPDIKRWPFREHVDKGTFVKASPSENWFSDVAVKTDEKKEKVKEWYARCLCVFRAKNAEGEEGAYVYVKYYEAAGQCPVTTCLQLSPGRVDTRYAVVDVECIKRVVHICRSYVNKKVMLLNKFLLCE
ncbi:unnamed protein product [Closterium sp. NIES-64]|nr:unnamed protein product [Closterium sp. NIES-64]CAI5959658.1 unnamed protein product [Closterium sp. NIES-64]